jgi:hypothetical protein
MPSLQCCKCVTTMFGQCGSNEEKKTGETIKPGKKKRRGSVLKNGIIYTQTPDDEIEGIGTFADKAKKVTFVQEPDIGFLWVFLTDVVRWITSPLVSSVVVFGLSFWFTMIHVDGFKECKLSTEFRLDGLEIKQQWRNSTMRITYGEECSMQQNPILSNLGSIMVFFLTIALGAGLDKYKETLRMYEEITGDIKAIGMLMVHLTFDHEKYDYKEGKGLIFKDNVETVYRKIRYLLASLGPTVKNTLAGGEYEIQYEPNTWSWLYLTSYMECGGKYSLPRIVWLDPFAAISDRKYYVVRKDLDYCSKLCFSTTTEFRNYWKDSIVNYTDEEEIIKKAEEKMEIMQSDKKSIMEKRDKALKHFKIAKPARDRLLKALDGNIDSEIQYALYSKIEDIHDKTDMDAFECTMTVLLDELMRLFENGLGFGEDEGSAIISAAIERWNAIYATWGTMASLKTFSEPLAVNMFRLLLVGTYAYFVPIGYLKYVGTDVEDFIMWYVAGEMFIFCLMWWLAFAVRNPFKNSWVIRNVNRLAYSTQFQVLHLMAYQRIFDSTDYGSNSKYGYLTKKDSDVADRYSFFSQERWSEEKALERLIKAVNKRNITVKNDNRGLERIISEAFTRMENDTKTTLNELKEIITRIMTEIKEFDRDALATELDIIMRNNKTDKGTKLGGYGNLSQKEADARRRQEAEKRNRKKQLRSRIRLGSLNSQRSSYLAF